MTTIVIITAGQNVDFFQNDVLIHILEYWRVITKSSVELSL